MTVHERELTTHQPVKPQLKNSKPFYRSKIFWIPLSIVLALLLFIYCGVSIYAANAFTQVSDRPKVFATTPADYNLAYQEVSFSSAASDKLTLRGWWIPRANSRQALILVHGKAESRTAMLNESRALWESGYNLLYFDLRGHGTSDGNHYYFGQYESWDTIGAFNFVKSKGFASEEIGLLGHSMGAATSLLALGHSSEIKVVFSDSSFADFGEVASARMPVEKGLPVFFMPGIFTAGRLFFNFDVDQLRPEVVLKSLSDRHIFLAHGEIDSVIPASHLYRLQRAGGANIVGTWIAPGADHTKAYDLYPKEYLQRVESFFATYLAR
ncbi:MAG TPA: alpha/beta fold hydrolase [Chloroflexia bacterium]|nr:alpha/beta fold hydrolase [Chloroflexia bacterium]